MAMARSATGEKRSSLMAALASFHHVSAAFSSAMRSLARSAARAFGSHSAILSATGARLIVMGFRIPQDRVRYVPTQGLPTIANFDDVKWQTVSGHPDSVLYQLLIGDRNSKRDKIAAGVVLTSLFIMEFEPGGTNFPHHHDKAEEIYLVLDGSGDMVAGGGADGVEGRHSARAGDAYFFRLNCTVGFYGSRNAGPKPRILAVRSLYPFSKEID